MKKIPLTQGKEALVDDCDYEFLIKFNWCAVLYSNSYYARAWVNEKVIFMHRAIMERIKPGFQGNIDHKNINGLNNQRQNLRIATKSQNGANRGPTKNNTSGFKGVCWDESRQKWCAQIRYQGTTSNLGRFNCKIKAAKAYDCAAWSLWKDYVKLNFPEEL